MKNRHVHKEIQSSECQICGKVFDRAANLKFHLASHKDKEKFKCAICAAELKGYGGLCQHVEQCHDIEKTKITLTCDLCDSKYYSTERLDDHMRSKHCGSYRCLDRNCTLRFRRKHKVKFHLKHHHNWSVKVKLIEIIINTTFLLIFY